MVVEDKVEVARYKQPYTNLSITHSKGLGGDATCIGVCLAQDWFCCYEQRNATRIVEYGPHYPVAR